MNPGQMQFYNFFLERVEEDKKEEAKAVLLDGFKKQEEGTFDKVYFESIKPTYMAFISDEFKSEVTEAMNHFASRL